MNPVSLVQNLGNPSTTVDAIAAPVRALAELFNKELASVKFPDVDAATLTAVVARVDGQQIEVTRLEEELARARGQLDTSRDELGRLAARAHAYARVYTEDNPALQSCIDAITLPRARARPMVSTTATTATVHATPVEGIAPRKGKKKSARDEVPSQLFGDEVAGAAELADDLAVEIADAAQ